MKPIKKFVICSLFLLLVVGCETDTTAYLSVTHIDYEETYRNVILDLPDGTYQPDNPYFDIDNPDTWTGNMAQYVNHNYLYSVSYSIKNTGSYTAYDAEIEIYYRFDNGDFRKETIYLGDIEPYERIHESFTVGCTNKQMVECSCEVYWFD